MDTREIANRLVEYCRKGDWLGAHNELYAKDAVSIEPYETPDFKKETKGLAEINAKGKKFDDTIEKVNKLDVTEPVIAGNTIAFRLDMDVNIKGKGRMSMPELCVYQVKDGKIVKEEFFV